MILNNTPQNEAIISNVGEIGEFRIRNSAKAFSILSSGLYANKIRAIVRELSCNAVDSHIAAGKDSTPFDVHLPNNLEPWFSIRDYGTGLDHEQVKNIYTTYFESTKTNSNAFIGALGLGSKSPFSYTDNFTVTAIKDGRKGIYSAFINGEGVPSIALMMEEPTEDLAGVEVKFSVNNQDDFYKFREEASQVYTYFKLRPVVSGSKHFEFSERSYLDKDVIPGVHYTGTHYSVAVMGNIAYTISVPNSAANLGQLENLLSCGLEIHFEIGELDFQASREGLSYIPSTIEAIKRKLDALNSVLTVKLAEEAEKIENFWDRAFFLDEKKNQNLWRAAVKKYVVDSKFPLMKTDFYVTLDRFVLKSDDLAKKYNISIKGFTKSRGVVTASAIKPNTETDHTKKDASGKPISWQEWHVPVDAGVYFVCNDLKTGATERAKYHWRNFAWGSNSHYHSSVYILEAYDRSKEIDTEQFFKDLYQPKNILMASALMEKPRQKSSLGANVKILRLEFKKKGYYSRDEELVWQNAGEIKDFDDTETYYYLPLSGFTPVSNFGETNCKFLMTSMRESGLAAFSNITIHGVRKGDLEFVKTQKNWINVEDYIVDQLKNISHNFMMSLVLNSLDEHRYINYNSNIIKHIKEVKSPYIALVEQIKGIERSRIHKHHLDVLCQRYTPGSTINPTVLKEKFEKECKEVSKRYPLLQYVHHHAEAKEVANYINMIDSNKGI